MQTPTRQRTRTTANTVNEDSGRLIFCSEAQAMNGRGSRRSTASPLGSRCCLSQFSAGDGARRWQLYGPAPAGRSLCYSRPMKQTTRTTDEAYPKLWTTIYTSVSVLSPRRSVPVQLTTSKGAHHAVLYGRQYWKSKAFIFVRQPLPLPLHMSGTLLHASCRGCRPTHERETSICIR